MTNLASKIYYFSPIPIEGIRKVNVRSPFGAVIAFSSNTAAPHIEVKGEAITTSEINIVSKITDNELTVNVMFFGDCFDSNYFVEIALPDRLLEELSVYTTNSAITFNKVTAQNIFCRSSTGNIVVTDSIFGNANLVTLKGDINFEGTLIGSSVVDIAVLSGNVNFAINNVSSADICINAMPYSCPKNKTGYACRLTAYSEISDKISITINGNKIA